MTQNDKLQELKYAADCVEGKEEKSPLNPKN